MQKILMDAEVPGSKIIIDTAATDTMDTIVNASAIIRAQGYRPVFVCSDDYHVPRCWLVTRITLGDCHPVWVSGSRHALGVRKWAWFCCRELVATVVDVLLALKFRLGAFGRN